MRDTEQASELRDGDVVLGDDWVIPQDPESAELREKRSRRNLFSLRGSPLARKIITFNLIALVILVTGLLYRATFPIITIGPAFSRTPRILRWA